MLRAAVERPAWKSGDLLVLGGAAAGVAACAATAGLLYERFAADLGGLSAFDRAALALWDFRPVSAALFALAALAVFAGGRLEGRLRPTVAVLAGAFAGLGLIVVLASAWVGARGFVGEEDGLAIRFTGGERVMTVLTQALGWLPLAAFFALLALRLTEQRPVEEAPAEESLVAEMDELWRERLAYSPRRERGRELLGRIRALEAQGKLTEARELAEEMRRLE
jgi:hypothetical protein